MKILPRESSSLPWGLLLLRLTSGGLMLTHGLPKLIGFSEKMESFPDPIGLGSPFALTLTVLAEVLCAALLILGVKTRLVVIPLAITMFVAAFVIHAADPLQKKELAIMYLSAYLALFLAGGGKFQLKA
jgi:putative oxidoreductase